MPSYESQYDRPVVAHNVNLTGRRKLVISGVQDVESFDEASIAMATAEGFLIVRGSQLHIEKLSLDGGEVLVEGLVDSLSYEEQDIRQGGLLSRLFRP